MLRASLFGGEVPGQVALKVDEREGDGDVASSGVVARARGNVMTSYETR